MTDAQNIIGKRFPVLDKGFIELIDFMPHPSTGVSGDLAIVNAARVSFLGESKGEEKDKKLLFYLIKHRHTSPLEMCVFKFRVHAPVLTFWQWARHRAASYNSSSGRYVEFKEDEFYVPDEWRLQSKDNKQGSDGTLDTVNAAHLTRKLASRYQQGYDDYEMALKYGVAREQARLFLHGWGSYYTWIVKVDAHNLMGFLKQRMALDAQYEIRVYADVIYREMFKPLLPWTAEAFEKFTLNKETSDG